MYKFIAAAAVLTLAHVLPAMADQHTFDPAICTDIAPQGVDISAALDDFLAMRGQTGNTPTCTIEDDPTRGPIPVVREVFTGGLTGFVLIHRSGTFILQIEGADGPPAPSGNCLAYLVDQRPDIAVSCRTDIIFHRDVYFYATLDTEGRPLDFGLISESGTDGGLAPEANGTAFRATPADRRVVELAMPGLGLVWPMTGYGEGFGHYISGADPIAEILDGATDPRGALHVQFFTLRDDGGRTEYGESVVPQNLINSAATEYRMLVSTMEGTLGEFVQRYGAPI